jgi:hypothetical protein
MINVVFTIIWPTVLRKKIPNCSVFPVKMALFEDIIGMGPVQKIKP